MEPLASNAIELFTISVPANLQFTGAIEIDAQPETFAGCFLSVEKKCLIAGSDWRPIDPAGHRAGFIPHGKAITGNRDGVIISIKSMSSLAALRSALSPPQRSARHSHDRYGQPRYH